MKRPTPKSLASFLISCLFIPTLSVAEVSLQEMNLEMKEKSGSGRGQVFLTHGGKRLESSGLTLAKTVEHLGVHLSAQQKFKVAWPNYLKNLKNFQAHGLDLTITDDEFGLNIKRYFQTLPKKTVLLEGGLAQCQADLASPANVADFMDQLIVGCLQSAKISVKQFQSEKAQSGLALLFGSKTKKGRGSELKLNIEHNRFILHWFSHSLNLPLKISGQIHYAQEKKILKLTIDEGKMGAISITPLVLSRLKKWDRPYVRLEKSTLYVHLQDV